MRVLFVTAVLAAGLSGRRRGPDLQPSKDSHEADLFAHFSVPLAFSVGARAASRAARDRYVEPGGHLPPRRR